MRRYVFSAAIVVLCLHALAPFPHPRGCGTRHFQQRNKSSDRNLTIVFRAPVRGQGVGNMLFGLAAALAFAQQMNASICVDWPIYNRFVAEPQPPCRRGGASVQYFNFGYSDTRAAIEQRARNSHVLTWMGNHVWDKAARFAQFMDPFCQSIVGPSPPIPTVAHIRIGDTERDARGILKRPEGWQTLRRCLPREAFVLSNEKRTFAELPHHAHSADAMGHSAIARLSREGERRIWHDWCVIRQADVVYYTPSGFSESAFYFGRHTRVVELREGYDCAQPA